MFKISKEAKDWFNNLDVDLLEFDKYYYCLMVGLASGEKEVNLRGKNIGDILNNFPEDYSASKSIIISIFLNEELSKQGINLKNKGEVYRCIKDYIDSDSSSKLSNEGFNEMNKYVSRGFELLRENLFDEKPYKFNLFLDKYNRIIKKLYADKQFEG